MSPINGVTGHNTVCGHDTTLILDSVNNYHHHHHQHQQSSHYHSHHHHYHHHHYSPYEYEPHHHHHARIDHFGTQLKISSGPKRDKQTCQPPLPNGASAQQPVRFAGEESHNNYLLHNDLAELGISLAKLALHAEGAPIIVCEEDVPLGNVKNNKFTSLKNRRKSYRLLPAAGYLMPDIESFPGLMNSSLSNAYHRFQQNSAFLNHQHGSILGSNGKNNNNTVTGQDMGHKHLNVSALNAMALQQQQQQQHHQQQQQTHQVTHIQQQFSTQVFHENWSLSSSTSSSSPAGVNGQQQQHLRKLSSGVLIGNGNGPVGVNNNNNHNGIVTPLDGAVGAVDNMIINNGVVDHGQDETCSLGSSSCLDDVSSSFSSISASSSLSYSSSPPSSTSSSVSLILEQFHKESATQADCFNMLHCDRKPHHHHHHQHLQHQQQRQHVITSEASTSSADHLLCLTDDDGVQFSSNSSSLSSSAVSPSSMSNSSLLSSSSLSCASPPFRKSSLCSSSISSLSSVTNLSNNFSTTMPAQPPTVSVSSPSSSSLSSPLSSPTSISTMSTASFVSNFDVNIDQQQQQQSLKSKKLSRTIRARKRKKSSPPPSLCAFDDTPTNVEDNWPKISSATPPARPWIPLAKPTESPIANVFTVMCYNVLCEKYATRQLYGYCPNWAMLWDYRKRSIMLEIKNFDSDIISLQEVETEQFYSFFQPELKTAGYEGIFSPKSRAKTMGENERRHVDGCAIFYKTDKFSMVNHTLVEFNQLAMNISEGSENMLNRVMPKDNIALIALLQTKEPDNDDLSSMEPKMSSGQPLIVCTAHIHWDPEFCDVKVIQTMMLTNELRKFADDVAKQFRLVPQGQKADPNLVPIILCGDLNSLPDSGVVEYLTNSRISVDHPDFKGLSYNGCLKKISTVSEKNPDYYAHGFNMLKAYKDGVLPFTNYTFDFKGVIDYIFCSRDTMSVLGVLGPLSEAWLEDNKVVGCPHQFIPSDHFPLVVELEMIPKQLVPGTGNGGGGNSNGSSASATTNGHRR